MDTTDIYTSIDYTLDRGLTRGEVVDLQNEKVEDLANWLDFDENLAIFNLLTYEDEF